MLFGIFNRENDDEEEEDYSHEIEVKVASGVCGFVFLLFCANATFWLLWAVFLAEMVRRERANQGV